MFLCYHIKLTTKDAKFTKLKTKDNYYYIFSQTFMFFLNFVVNNILFLSGKAHHEGREIHEVKDNYYSIFSQTFVLFLNFVVNNVPLLSCKAHHERHEGHEVKDNRYYISSQTSVFFLNFVVNNILFIFVVNFSTSNFWLFRLNSPFL